MRNWCFALAKFISPRSSHMADYSDEIESKIHFNPLWKSILLFHCRWIILRWIVAWESRLLEHTCRQTKRCDFSDFRSTLIIYTDTYVWDASKLHPNRFRRMLNTCERCRQHRAAEARDQQGDRKWRPKEEPAWTKSKHEGNNNNNYYSSNNNNNGKNTTPYIGKSTWKNDKPGWPGWPTGNGRMRDSRSFKIGNGKMGKSLYIHRRLAASASSAPLLQQKLNWHVRHFHSPYSAGVACFFFSRWYCSYVTAWVCVCVQFHYFP